MKICSLLSKTFLKMAGGGTPNPTSLDAPLAISYENYEKRLAYRYFSHLAPLICSFSLKSKIKRGTGGGGMAQCPPP